MKKITLLSILTLALVSAISLTAFSVKNATPAEKDPDFKEFLKQFPKQSLPYSLDEKDMLGDLQQYVADINNPKKSYTPSKKVNRLDWEYYKFLPGLKFESSFSRVPMQTEPVAMFALNDNYAVIYRSSRSFHFGYSTYKLAYFDKKGEQLSLNTIGMVGTESIMSAVISKDLQAELKTWKIDWDKDYLENGLDDNKITGLSYLESKHLDLINSSEAVNPFDDKKFRKPEPKEEILQEQMKTK